MGIRNHLKESLQQAEKEVVIHKKNLSEAEIGLDTDDDDSYSCFDKGMVMKDICLLAKSGGKSGTWTKE